MSELIYPIPVNAHVEHCGVIHKVDGALAYNQGMRSSGRFLAICVSLDTKMQGVYINGEYRLEEHDFLQRIKDGYSFEIHGTFQKLYLEEKGFISVS